MRAARDRCPQPDVEFVNGGTGGMHLLEYFTGSDHVIIIDAVIDDKPDGTFSQCEPRFSSGYPPSLMSHDFGLKDLLDALPYIKAEPEIILFTLSISQEMDTTPELSPQVAAAVATAADEICRLLKG